MGCDPQRIDLVHPVVGLAERIVRIATARPVAERHRGRDAGLAGMNLPAEFRRQPRQVEDIDRESHFDEHRLGELDQPPALRHLAGAGMLAARRAVDDEHARLRGRIVVAPLRFKNGLAGGEPVDRDFIVRIGKARSRLAGQRRFSRMAVGVPRGRDDGVEFALQRPEGRIDEAAAIALLEFLARQFDGRHSLANVRLRHGSILARFDCGGSTPEPGATVPRGVAGAPIPDATCRTAPRR